MKLKYELEFVQIGDEWTCVPLDTDSGDSFHGVLNINESAKEMLEAIQSHETEEDAFNAFQAIYPEEDAGMLKTEFKEFLEQLIQEGILIP